MEPKTKLIIPPGLLYIAENIKSKQNILGAPRAIKANWAKDLNLHKQSETIFFAGCGYQYTAGLESIMSLIRKMDQSILGSELPITLAGIQKKSGLDLANLYNKMTVKNMNIGCEVLVDAVKVLRNLGVDFGYLGEDEPCCGGLLHYAGMEQDFINNSHELYDKLKSLGIKQIISIVPSCTYTLKNLINKHMQNSEIEVVHFSEVVLKNIQSIKLQFSRKVKVTYHDPCQLSRYLHLIDEPRQILKAIKDVEFIETNWTNREWSTCCGGGGGFEAVFPELSEILAVNRTRELLDTGAEIIVTHCPGCIMQIKDGLKKLKNDVVQVLDLAQIIAMAMEKNK
jgi:dimethylglycine catabolism B